MITKRVIERGIKYTIHLHSGSTSTNLQGHEVIKVDEVSRHQIDTNKSKRTEQSSSSSNDECVIMWDFVCQCSVCEGLYSVYI